MNAITVPEFYFPFESGVNQYLAQIQDGSLQWIRSLGSAENNSVAYHRSKVENHAALVAYALPQLPLHDLQLAADAMTWFFIHDDYMDGVFRGSAAEMEHLHRQFVEACTVAPISQPADLLGWGLHNICRRIEARCGADWLRSFRSNVKDFLQAIAWEQDLRNRGIMLDLASYMLLRPVVGTIYMVFSLMAMLHNIPAGAGFLRHLYIRKLTDLAGLQMTFYNDVWSFNRDLGEGNRSNLVSILQSENRASLQEAVNLAVDLTNKQVVAFLRLKELLPDFGPHEDGMAHSYVAGLETFMTGHRNWMLRTSRFQMS